MFSARLCQIVATIRPWPGHDQQSKHNKQLPLIPFLCFIMVHFISLFPQSWSCPVSKYCPSNPVPCANPLCQITLFYPQAQAYPACYCHGLHVHLGKNSTKFQAEITVINCNSWCWLIALLMTFSHGSFGYWVSGFRLGIFVLVGCMFALDAGALRVVTKYINGGSYELC